MTGAAIRIEVDDAEVRQALNGLLASAGDLTPAMDNIGAMLVTSVLHRFETGVGPDGTPWKPSQRAIRESGQTLVDQGNLMKSMTHVAGRDFVEVGTNVVYAAIHQFGGKTGRGHAVELPARPYLGIDAGDRAEILAILRDHLIGGVA